VSGSKIRTCTVETLAVHTSMPVYVRAVIVNTRTPQPHIIDDCRHNSKQRVCSSNRYGADGASSALRTMKTRGGQSASPRPTHHHTNNKHPTTVPVPSRMVYGVIKTTSHSVRSFHAGETTQTRVSDGPSACGARTYLLTAPLSQTDVRVCDIDEPHELCARVVTVDGLRVLRERRRHTAEPKRRDMLRTH